MPGTGHQEHPCAQGTDDLAAGQGRVRRGRRRPRGDRLPRPELHRRARGPAPDRGLLLHGDAGAQRVRGPGGGDRRPDARAAEVLRQGHGRAAVLGRRGQDDLRQRLRHLGAEVAGRGVRRLGDAGRRRVLGLPAARHGGQEEDPRPERGQALRHQGAGRVPAARPGRDARGPRGRPTGRRQVAAGGRGVSQGGLGGSSPRAILRALETVRDPELDKPITSLGFVVSCTVSADGYARVRLRLPTYFCAPNFAFLMVADAYEAVTGTPGVRSATVVLEDHFASDSINAGVAARAGFVASFDGEAAAELDELRAQFLRKAVMAGTDQVCRPLLASGTTPERLRELRLVDVPPSRELDRLRQRRAELGLPTGDDALLLIDPETGAP